MMYVLETEDRSNGLTDGSSMTPGRNFAIRGSYLRVLEQRSFCRYHFAQYDDRLHYQN